MLTRRQAELLNFIDAQIAGNHRCPSIDEMCSAIGVASKSGIVRLVDQLVYRGFVRRSREACRNIEIVRKPACGAFGAKRPAAFREARMMGWIGAGGPVATIESAGEVVRFPSSFLAAGEHFALEVRGDSKVEAGILDGDVAVFRKQSYATSGHIVAAVVDGAEALLRRWRTRRESVVLEAANASYPARIVGPDEVCVRGRLVRRSA